FAKGPLMDGLYWESWYNSDNFSDPRKRTSSTTTTSCSACHGFASFGCTVADDFKDEITFCHSSFSPGVEEKRPFGYMNSSAWNYSTEKQLRRAQLSPGEISSYPGSGYYVDLSRNKEDSTAQLNELFTGLWIDRGTRVVFVDFTVYNANINLFCVVKLVLELPATGGAIPSSDFRTVKLLRYVEPKDYFVLVCEGIFMLFICYYIVEEVIEIKRNKLDYFKTFWNWLDIIVILVSLICGGFNVYRTVTVGKKLQELLQDESRFPDFDFLSYWQQQFNNAIAFTLFLAWVKFFKYISFNKTMTQLSSTLSACAKDLMGFAVMFFILGYLIFGTQIKDFREFHHSVFTLFRIILGDFDLPPELRESANRVLVAAVLPAVRVFRVLSCSSTCSWPSSTTPYSEVKDGPKPTSPTEFEMADYFKERASKMLQKLNLKQEKILDIQSALKTADMNDDKQLDFEEWRDLSSRRGDRGYADGEIEALFSKYDQDGDRVLDEREQRAMTSEARGAAGEPQRVDSKRVAAINRQIDSEKPAARGATAAASHAEPQVTAEEFSALAHRVDRMERSIGSVVSKIDAVLVKLDAVEAGKAKRREQMGKLLDAINETEGVTDEYKRQEMERMVREQVQRFDGEPSLVVTPQDEAAAASASAARVRPSSPAAADARPESPATKAAPAAELRGPGIDSISEKKLYF
uniref:EF-hand domain-containing protein n=1 Tax=Macrostomum lignano TaxID=282301 RepID=A0A1I8FPC1_9PLAT